jgi:hypothetical protein
MGYRSEGPILRPFVGMGSRCKGFLEVHYGDVKAKRVFLEAFLGFEVPMVRLSRPLIV